MAYLFSGTNMFDKPIGSWETTKVLDMTGMFLDARACKFISLFIRASRLIGQIGRL